MDEINIGSLVKSGTLIWEDTPNHTVYLTRDGDKIRITTVQKVEAIIEANSRESAEFNRTGSHGDFVKVASIPNSLYWDWQRQYEGDQDAIKRKLNDADFAKFRTNDWRL